MKTIRVITAPGTNASMVADAHCACAGRWRNSVDCCDINGCGRVFIDCDEDEAAAISEALEADNRVVSYSECDAAD